MFNGFHKFSSSANILLLQQNAFLSVGSTHCIYDSNISNIDHNIAMKHEVGSLTCYTLTRK